MHTEWIEVRPAKVKKGRLPTEGTLIAKRLVPQDYIIALDRSGKEYDFEGLATPIEQLSCCPIAEIGLPLLSGAHWGIHNKS